MLPLTVRSSMSGPPPPISPEADFGPQRPRIVSGNSVSMAPLTVEMSTSASVPSGRTSRMPPFVVLKRRSSVGPLVSRACDVPVNRLRGHRSGTVDRDVPVNRPRLHPGGHPRRLDIAVDGAGLESDPGRDLDREVHLHVVVADAHPVVVAAPAPVRVPSPAGRVDRADQDSARVLYDLDPDRVGIVVIRLLPHPDPDLARIRRTGRDGAVHVPDRNRVPALHGDLPLDVPGQPLQVLSLRRRRSRDDQ